MSDRFTSATLKGVFSSGIAEYGPMKGKSKGEKNSQFGTMWITNGISNKKLRNDEDIPIGWKRGRVIKS